MYIEILCLSFEKVFRTLYLLNMWMDLHVVDTMPVVRYWFEVLYHTIPTHLNDLEVMDFKIFG